MRFDSPKKHTQSHHFVIKLKLSSTSRSNRRGASKVGRETTRPWPSIRTRTTNGIICVDGSHQISREKHPFTARILRLSYVGLLNLDRRANASGADGNEIRFAGEVRSSVPLLHQTKDFFNGSGVTKARLYDSCPLSAIAQRTSKTIFGLFI
jgi:hypothetical protein